MKIDAAGIMNAINEGYDHSVKNNMEVNSVMCVFGADEGVSVVAHGKFKKSNVLGALSCLCETYRIESLDELVTIYQMMQKNQKMNDLLKMSGMPEGMIAELAREDPESLVKQVMQEIMGVDPDEMEMEDFGND